MQEWTSEGSYLVCPPYDFWQRSLSSLSDLSCKSGVIAGERVAAQRPCCDDRLVCARDLCFHPVSVFSSLFIVSPAYPATRCPPRHTLTGERQPLPSFLVIPAWECGWGGVSFIAASAAQGLPFVLWHHHGGGDRPRSWQGLRCPRALGLSPGPAVC